MIHFFTTMYEWLLGRPLPSPDTLTYREVIFPNAGLWMLGISLVFVLIYYYGLNNRVIRTSFFHPGFWVLFLFVTAITVGFTTSYLAQKEGVDPHSYSTWLALLNATYSMLAYIIFSFFLKRWSIAYTSPTRWPSKY